MDNQSTEVAIVIPNYNHQEYVKKAVESSLSQSYPCKIIVVDDGSIDNSRSVLESYEKHGVEVIYKKNGGPGSARNVGVNAALKLGLKYIQLLDADDWMYDKKVETLYNIAESNDEIGIVYDDYLHYYNDHDFYAREYKISTTPEMMWRNCQIQCNSLVKSWVFKKAQLSNEVYYDESMRVAQDYDFWLRAIQHCVAWHHPEVLSVVRMGSNNSADPIRGKVREECLRKLRQRNAHLYL